MYVGPMKTKKINLSLLLLIVLFIIAIIFTIIHINNSSKANSDSRYSNINSQSSNKNNIVTSLKNRETNGSRIGVVDSFSNFHDIDESTASDSRSSNVTTSIVTNENESQEATPSTELHIVKANNHTYTFDNNYAISLKNDGPDQYVELKYKNFLYKVNTTSISFSELKSNQNLKEYIEKTYKLQVTSDIKSGSFCGNNLIICTIAENNEVAYLLITPLNDSEILVLKIFNNKNKSAMIEDLTEILNNISTLKSSIQ